ncbi:hypothetical protein CRENBAI_005589 [Crenichthys baileyi]|uniref:Uncharacterized protein n=1 Tax=Crenichthys baileyi TaxID=28760 RepID=A0AAV9S872_9TELE
MNYQLHLANSAAIRSEIQRFESVHPNIYSIYELLDRVEEPLLQNQIREHVIAIEEVTPGAVQCQLMVQHDGAGNHLSSTAAASSRLCDSLPSVLLETTQPSDAAWRCSSGLPHIYVTEVRTESSVCQNEAGSVLVVPWFRVLAVMFSSESHPP